MPTTVSKPDRPAALGALFERLEEIYDPTLAERIVITMAAPKRVGLFLNPLAEVSEPSADPPRDAGTAGTELGTPIPGLRGFRFLSASQRQTLLEHSSVTDGALYPMNPSSGLAVECMDVTAEHQVLDLAAAPGGKALLMAARMANQGRIAAVEPVKGRFHRMRANLERCGVSNVAYYLTDGRTVGAKVGQRFDRVLLDAPCSSEARIRLEDPGTFDHWKPRKIRESARKQKGLIRSAFRALKPGGTLTYCTCSFAPEENELVVAYLLASEPEADLVPLPLDGRLGVAGVSAPTLLPGLTGWQGRDLDERLARCVRVVPDDLWDGFFLGRIVRTAS